MANKFLNLLAVASLAVIASSYGPMPVGALSPDSHGDLFARQHGMRSHHEFSKKNRSVARRQTKQCRVRSTSASVEPTSSAESVTPASTPTPEPEPEAEPTTSEYVAPETTSAASSESHSTYTGSGSAKACLAWPNGETGTLSSWKTPHTSLLYTWSSYPVSEASEAGFNVIPQLWGDKDISVFQDNMPKYTSPTMVLFVNEPNESGQSSMSASHAVDLWWKYMEPLKAQGHTLVSPAVSGSPEGFEWMKDFMNQCSGCSIDIVATHWYDVNADDFIAYQNKYHDKFGLPIIVTEFACQNFNGGAQCSSGEIWSFMDTVTSWMDETDWILNYCYFGAMHDMFNVNYDNRLMASDGTPNSLGYRFINGY